MTVFNYQARAGGGWNNPQNWFNTKSGKFGDGVPGKGDVAEPSAGQEDISGGGGDGANVLGFTFDGGTFDVGIFDSGTVNGATVNAAEIGSFGGNGVLVTVDAGRLTVGGIVGGALSVTGGSADITGDVVPAAKGGNPSVISVTGGAVEIRGALDGVLNLDGSHAAATVSGRSIAGSVTADFGIVSLAGPTSLDGGLSAGDGGRVTVSQNLTVTKGAIDASGAGSRLTFDRNLTMTAGASLAVTDHAEIAAQNLTARSGPLIVSPDGNLTVGGNLALENGATLLLRFAGGAVTVDHTLIVAKVGAGGVELAVGSTVFAHAATITKSATVDDAGVLGVAGAVAGGGTVTIESGGSFAVGGADGNVAVAFTAGTGEVLSLGKDKLFKAEIGGFGTGDTIELLDVRVTGKSFSHGVLTLSDGARLKFAGSHHLDNFVFSRHGPDTDITFRAAPGSGVAAARPVEFFAAAGGFADGSGTPSAAEPPFGGAAAHAMLGFR